MKILNAAMNEFASVYSEIEKNFIPDERRDFTDALQLFEEKKYEILKFIYNGEEVGFITVWPFSDFVFAEHFVIYEKYRNLGYGSKALCALKSLFPKIVLEAEPAFAELQKRRLNFYIRNGFLMNDESYFQPAYRKDGSAVPLVIMSYPCVLNNFDEVVAALKKEVYLKNED